MRRSFGNLIGGEGRNQHVNTCFGLSRRTIDNRLQRSMPHLKLGARRVLFDLREIEAWFPRECRTAQ